MLTLLLITQTTFFKYMKEILPGLVLFISSMLLYPIFSLVFECDVLRNELLVLLCNRCSPLRIGWDHLQEVSAFDLCL